MVTSSHLFDKIANQCNAPYKIASIRNKPSGNKPRWGGMVVGMGMMVAEDDWWVAAVLVWNEDDGRRWRPPCLVAEGSWTLRQRIITNDACRLGTLLRGCGGGGLVLHRKGPDAGGASGPWDSAYSGATIKTFRRGWGFRRLEYSPWAVRSGS